MGYAERIRKSREKGYHHAIATKIRDMMGALRKSSNENRKRRWIWELLQNAKDAAYQSQGILVDVSFNSSGQQGELVFRHNGKPFTVDDVTFLVEQVSTKDQKKVGGEAPKKTGKFGTGFLTTHLLSEKVFVKSIIKDPDLDYREFELLLDRTGRDVEEIIQSVEKSLRLLDNLDAQPAIENFRPDELNTSFRYQLSEKGISVARIGIHDLEQCIPYVLVFNNRFHTIIDRQRDIVYKLLSNRDEVSEGITIYTVKKIANGNPTEIYIAFLSIGITSIAIEIEYKEENIFLKDFHSSVPRLFCDFPLVGTEDFYFPVIVNDPSVRRSRGMELI